MRHAPGRMLLLALAIGLVGTSGVASGQEQANPPPLDFIAQRDKLSQPIYPQTITEVVNLEMADGETIYMEITRPDPEAYPELGPLPVVLEASPYHGTIATRIGDRIFPDPREGNKALGLTGYFAPRGYAVVMMGLRGTGRSTGCLDHLGPKDASDLKETIEWLAVQDWSNGRIGMTGHSYVGSTPSAAAAQRPKGLVTIAPSAGLASMYDHQFQAGVPYFFQWIGPMVAYEGLALVRDLPPGFTEPILTGAPTGDNWSGTPSPQTGCGMQNSALTAGSGQITGQYELWHAKRDHRAEAADADIPVFMIHGVNDNAARIPAAEWFFANRYQRDGDKVWLGQWDHGSTNGRCGNPNNSRALHPNCRFLQWQYALHAWFDHHLMQRTWTDGEGVEHPIDTGPPVEVFLNGEAASPDIGAPLDPATWGTRVFTADAWKKYPRVELYPDATDGSLGFSRPAEAGTATLSGTDAPSILVAVPSPHIGEDLEFRSEPLEEDALFVGVPKLDLDASVTNSQVVHLTAALYRETPGGEREPMNFCAIQPLLRNGVATPEPMVPGQRMDLPMQCFTMAHHLAAGDRVVLELSTASRHHATFGSEFEITVFTGPNGSVYRLPEVPEYTLHEDVPLRG